MRVHITLNKERYPMLKGMASRVAGILALGVLTAIPLPAAAQTGVAGERQRHGDPLRGPVREGVGESTCRSLMLRCGVRQRVRCGDEDLVDAHLHERRPKRRSIRDFCRGQVQRWSTGTPRRACSMCRPQPAQVGLPQCLHVTR
jgi:hypothetical protein